MMSTYRNKIAGRRFLVKLSEIKNYLTPLKVLVETLVTEEEITCWKEELDFHFSFFHSVTTMDCIHPTICAIQGADSAKWQQNQTEVIKIFLLNSNYTSQDCAKRWQMYSLFANGENWVKKPNRFSGYS